MNKVQYTLSIIFFINTWWLKTPNVKCDQIISSLSNSSSFV